MRKVTDGAVRKWIKAGRLPVHPDGIDPVEADAAIEANRSGSQLVKIAAPALEAPPLLRTSRGDFEAELAGIKVERARLALDKDRSEVIDIADVEEAVGELISQAQNRLLLMAHTLAEQLARTTEPVACRNILDHAIREALEGLSRYEVVV
jgi:hypothetical protein